MALYSVACSFDYFMFVFFHVIFVSHLKNFAFLFGHLWLLLMHILTV